MNKVFAEHVTNTAFFLSMSKKQITYLISINNLPFESGRYYESLFITPDTWFTSCRSLVAKGLIERVIDDPVKNTGYYKTTKAGEIVCLLLAEAGFVSQQSEQEKVA